MHSISARRIIYANLPSINYFALQAKLDLSNICKSTYLVFAEAQCSSWLENRIQALIRSDRLEEAGSLHHEFSRAKSRQDD